MVGWLMLRHLPLNRLWRILRETDLEAIRRGAESRFQVLVAADDLADAEQLARLIGESAETPASSGASGERHPWLLTIDASMAAPVIGRESFCAALLVSRTADLSPSLGSIRDDQAARGVPIVVVVIGAAGKTAAIVRPGEHQRVVATPDLNAGALDAVGNAVLTAVQPELRLGLGRQFSGLRTLLFTMLIDETARANASYAFTTGIAEIIPVLNVAMNIGDVVILTKNQLIMSYKIALVAGKSGTPRHLMGEIFGVLGAGLLFRQIARQLVGLIPVVGVAPKVAVAYGGTWAIGRAVVLWATAGQALTAESVRAFYDEGLKRGRQAARAIVSRRVRSSEASPGESAPRTGITKPRRSRRFLKKA
jgi:uncharacterized protein (DUF697 family)